ncbi:dienelactone hydrolase [Microdochium trichocladiopsis]|uniref:Dienelactone hydrolase n=1 Tax=Microdochium trichocladiopsis TaxID=1682393 RepID=A0A9P8XTY4_9PEZI|nr:dienelactone hydrolase [Microdochium trichocladiopsis]KAH7018053.1 dienelactone hydrolase [Microdochium trichocladiopsis]
MASTTTASTTSGDYLAQPSGPCCLKGTLHEGTPRGRYETLAGLQTYITEPTGDGVKPNGNVILYFPDVWGFFNNGLLVMDAFADAGYLVLGVDYFRGDPVTKYRKDRHDTTTSPGFDFDAWKDKHAAFAVDAVPRWVDAVVEKYGGGSGSDNNNSTTNTATLAGVTHTGLKPKFACTGYCFGAPYVCDELARGICSVGAFGHPAFLKEEHFRKITKPLFLSCAEIDHTFSAEARRRAIDILQEEKKVYHHQLFSGVEHGFALRGDPKDPYQRWVKEQSLSAIVQWFDFWLAQK